MRFLPLQNDFPCFFFILAYTWLCIDLHLERGRPPAAFFILGTFPQS
jgi:hypothetical protein